MPQVLSPSFYILPPFFFPTAFSFSQMSLQIRFHFVMFRFLRWRLFGCLFVSFTHTFNLINSYFPSPFSPFLYTRHGGKSSSVQTHLNTALWTCSDLCTLLQYTVTRPKSFEFTTLKTQIGPQYSIIVAGVCRPTSADAASFDHLEGILSTVRLNQLF